MNKKTIRIETTEEENTFLLYTPDGGKPSKFKLTSKKPVFNSYRKQAWAWPVVMHWKATMLQKERPASLKKLLKDVQKVIVGNNRVILVCADDDFVIKM